MHAGCRLTNVGVNNKTSLCAIQEKGFRRKTMSFVTCDRMNWPWVPAIMNIWGTKHWCAGHVRAATFWRYKCHLGFAHDQRPATAHARLQDVPGSSPSQAWPESHQDGNYRGTAWGRFPMVKRPWRPDLHVSAWHDIDSKIYKSLAGEHVHNWWVFSLSSCTASNFEIASTVQLHCFCWNLGLWKNGNVEPKPPHQLNINIA